MRILYVVLTLFLLSGCEQKETQETKKEDFNKETVLKNMGIDINADKITIDGNKTKVFLEELGTRIEKELNATQKEIEEGNFTSEKMGIEIKEEKVNIDLNKTKNFLQRIITLLESLTKGADK